MIDSRSSTWDAGNQKSEIVFAVDTTLSGKNPETTIIADITQDDAWITIDRAAAAELDAWR